VVRWGFWKETLQKWANEGHITKEQADGWELRGSKYDTEIGEKLGFDFNWDNMFIPINSVSLQMLHPVFEYKLIKELPNGIRHVLNEEGVIVMESPSAKGIPPEIEYTLKDRISWEENYKPRLKFSQDILDKALVQTVERKMIRFDSGGKEFLQKNNREFHCILYAGSIMGRIRNWLGLENFSILPVDDPVLFREMVDVVAEMGYQSVKAALESGVKVDIIHFWEDLCCKNGPLVSPKIFQEIAVPYYSRIVDLAQRYDIDLISVDCDGVIDALIPTWVNSGINVMFPIEVGTWGGTIKEMRDKFGKQLRGVGGMKKSVFAEDKTAVDEEIERLKQLVELGGYIPCPDHWISPDAKWDNVRYYCDRMHRVFD
jgi:hypothetical protein